MADYYPLLARALDALPDRTPAMRKAVYERARNALIGQLRSLEPPLPEADIEVERQALDNAIDRLETDYGAPPAGPVAAPEPRPEPIPELIPEPAPPARQPEPPPSLPPAAAVLPPASAVLAPEAARVEAPPREAAVPITARKAKAAAPAPDEPPAAAAPEPIPDLAAAGEAANGRRRPRIDVVAPRDGRSRLLRNVFVGIVLTVVIGLIAVAAFLLRDKPAGLAAGGAGTADTQPAEGADAKFSERIGGEPAQRPSSAGSAPSVAQTGQRVPASPPVQPDLAVAQRAVLIEENVAAPNDAPLSTGGRVVWRLDSVAGERGQPLETAIVATVSVPDAGFSLVMTVQRNLDQTLPASHTISLAFAGTGPEGGKRPVQDVGLLQAKDDENGRGAPVSGLPVRVRENLFLIGLSSLRGDVDRNTDLLLHKPWFDIALRYSTGQRAVLTFEKGGSGGQAVQGAFDQWR